jgi:hypothetical protein
MTTTTILLEVQNLHGVSTRLDSLADQYPVVSEGLLAIAGNIRDSAVLLELLVEIKISQPSQLQGYNPPRRICRMLAKRAEGRC